MSARTAISDGAKFQIRGMIELFSPAMTVALNGKVARKMPAGTPALLFSLRVAQLGAVMPQLFQICAYHHWHYVQPRQLVAH